MELNSTKDLKGALKISIIDEFDTIRFYLILFELFYVHIIFIGLIKHPEKREEKNHFGTNNESICCLFQSQGPLHHTLLRHMHVEHGPGSLCIFEYMSLFCLCVC